MDVGGFRMGKYKVNVGINYPPGKRAEPGDVVDDIPIGSLPDLLSQGVIEVADEKPKPTPAPRTRAKAKT
jgi:hypothetical protein